MRYFILTRFNIKIFKCDKHHNPVMTDKWLEDRFALFERYCFPSVMNQSVKDFEWICLFDKDTPEQYRERVDDYVKGFQGFIPVYLSQKESIDYIGQFRRIVASRCSGNVGERLITTYLDNDDMLHKDFVGKVVEYARNIDKPSVISFNYGIQFFSQHGYGTEVYYRNNHFLSLVEGIKEEKLPATIMSVSHYYLSRYRIDVIDDLSRDGMWVEVIHDKNVDNDVKMRTKRRYVNLSNSVQNYSVSMQSKNGRIKFISFFWWSFLRQGVRRLVGKMTKTPWPPYIREEELD